MSILYLAGIDLGQTADPSALAVLEKHGQREQAVYHLRFLKRFDLGTHYDDVVSETVRVLSAAPLTRPAEPLKGPALAIDATGVGKAVVELFQRRRPEGTCLLEFPTKSGHGVKLYSVCPYSAGETYPQRRVPALAVVEDLAVLDERRTGLRPRREVRAVDQFLLQGREEALPRRVIPPVRAAAHTADDPVVRQELRVALGVVACLYTLPPFRHVEQSDYPAPEVPPCRLLGEG